jgi:hypothetical protein
MVRYPHTVTISYSTTGNKDANGIWTPSVTTATFLCRVESNSGRVVIGKDGERIEYAYNVYFPPDTSGLDAIPDGAKLTYDGKTYTVIEIPPFQRQKVLRCG